MKRLNLLTGAIFLTLLLPLTARAAEYTLTIKDHRFTPEVLEIPAGEKVKITVVNNDATAEEFESYDLNREKVVSGNSKIVVFVGPLDPGTYSYFGEFHKDQATGKIIAK